MEKNLGLKKITFIDRVRKGILKAFGYREGKRFIDDTEPLTKNYTEIELGRIADIEGKLREIVKTNSKKNKLVGGLKKEEAEKLIEWVVQRDREMLFLKSDPRDDDLFGACGLSQGIVTTLLTSMGLSPRISNVNNTIRI